MLLLFGEVAFKGGCQSLAEQGTPSAADLPRPFRGAHSLCPRPDRRLSRGRNASGKKINIQPSERAPRHHACYPFGQINSRRLKTLRSEGRMPDLRIWGCFSPRKPRTVSGNGSWRLPNNAWPYRLSDNIPLQKLTWTALDLLSLSRRRPPPSPPGVSSGLSVRIPSCPRADRSLQSFSISSWLTVTGAVLFLGIFPPTFLGSTKTAHPPPPTFIATPKARLPAMEGSLLQTRNFLSRSSRWSTHYTTRKHGPTRSKR